MRNANPESFVTGSSQVSGSGPVGAGGEPDDPFATCDVCAGVGDDLAPGDASAFDDGVALDVAVAACAGAAA
jgi:hypothetical protein